MILSCAIIDDEPLAARLLASYAEKTPELKLTGTYDSAVSAMKVLRNNPVDLLFLDIQMPELSGLEFANIIPKETRIIFTTAFDRYAIDGYKVNAIDYLLPVSFSNCVTQSYCLSVCPRSMYPGQAIISSRPSGFSKLVGGSAA